MKKGSKHTPETRKRLAEMLLGYHKTDKFKKAHIASLKRQVGVLSPQWGRKRSAEVRDKIRQAKLKNPIRYWLGKTQPHFRGMNNPNWKGGVTTENEKARKSSEYKEWRINVFKRDNFTCRVCLKGGYVQANHIYPFRSHKELRYDVNNGITLCIECHRYTFMREHLFINLFQGILKNGFNSANTSKEATPSQQEQLRKVLWACVTVKGE